MITFPPAGPPFHWYIIAGCNNLMHQIDHMAF